MIGGVAMEATISSVPVILDEDNTSKLLDKGIDDMENGRVTSHEESMRILMQRYENYVIQNP